MELPIPFSKRSLLPVLLVCTLASSCARKSQPNALSPEHAKWMENRVRSYTYEFQARCYCLEAKKGPYLVRVEKGEIVSVNGQPYDRETMGRVFAIDSLFGELKANLARKPFSNEIVYDEKYGFPKEAYFDFYEDIRDDEYGWYIRDFTPLK
jgi:hypothetical protein